MKAQAEMPDKTGLGGKARLEDSLSEEERALSTEVSGSSDGGQPVREVHVWVDDLSEIAHKPDD